MQPVIDIVEARHSPDRLLQQQAEALQAAVADLLRIYQFRDRDKICCYDVSVTQSHALDVLVTRGPLRANVLSSVLLLDKSTTSRLLDALERKGYVERRPDPDDGRASVVAATIAGKALHRQINQDLVDQQRDIISALAPAVRDDVIGVIRELARAAETKVVAGEACDPTCCG